MDFLELLGRALGEESKPKDIDTLQMALRAAIIYVVTLAFVRLGKKRFLGRASAFDVVVGIMIGSIASRVITGNAPLVPGMAAAAVIVAMHWAFSGLALYSHSFGALVKGGTRLLVDGGEIKEEAMRASHMTRRDLDEALRKKGLEDLGQVQRAYLERDGSVSVIKN